MLSYMAPHCPCPFRRLMPVRVSSLVFLTLLSLHYATCSLITDRSDPVGDCNFALFSYKNQVYKNIRLQNGLLIKNMLRICQGLTLEKKSFDKNLYGFSITICGYYFLLRIPTYKSIFLNILCRKTL